MKYLFFDLEFASQIGGKSKICEFGYIVTDETFKVLESDNFIIDPNIKKSEWDYKVLKTILNRKMDEYEASFKFNKYYDDITKLINSSDLIFGHSLSGDAKALNDDCLRYKLPSINFEFYDVKEFYKLYSESDDSTSVINMLQELDIEGNNNYHDGNADAYNTMLVLKKLMEVLNLDLNKLIELCPSAKDFNLDYEVNSIKSNRLKRREALNNYLNNPSDYEGNKKNYFDIFRPFVRLIKDKSLFDYDVRYCFSTEFEDSYFNLIFKIAKVLYDNNYAYVSKPSLCDVYISYNDYDENNQIKENSKLNKIIELNDDGAGIDIISVEDFYNEIGFNEEEFNNVELPSIDDLFKDEE